MGIRISIIAMLFLSACGTTGEVNLSTPAHTTIEIEKVVPYECGIAPSYDPFIPLPVIWHEAMTIDGVPAAGLDEDGYKNLGKNTARWKKSTAELKAQRDFYRDCIERSKADAQ